MVSRCIEDYFLVFIHLCIAWAVKALLLSASASVPLFIFVWLRYTRALRLQKPHFVSRLRIVEWVKQAFAIDALLRWRNGVILWFQKVPCFPIAGLFTFGLISTWCNGAPPWSLFHFVWRIEVAHLVLNMLWRPADYDARFVKTLDFNIDLTFLKHLWIELVAQILYPLLSVIGRCFTSTTF